ncbi:Golgi SNAP receptor complex subunit 1 [Lasiodiplodia theobromae]|uniref:Golgi SNAP receptor complex member 1 n=1 Tax=Lasiodiplodia theobromae TaxID=45133 RepID=A0A5N5DKT7_9PEZI|nr:Vesicle transport v-snare protein [Lasiodiplodia theobromae]KAB2577474.1 Golgi SNAP receptor complex member 1 [Lasiodiplodia theobromae]KAF4535836.1 Vesicle transport v-snare protein [Lasiodiplodia theobromae]KAF9640450.1 Golgi SNAP receptor complex subunit 1 [Lasiodiplodia theobromae]
MASTGGGWAQLRQQARSLETQTESLFHTYSQYASMTNIPPKPTDEEQRTESQIRELLDKRDALIGQLTRLLDSSADLTSSALKQNNLARHREVLADHRRELSRLKNTISTARDRANLLSDVRSDIDAYRSANPAQAEADYMLDERRRIDNSHNMADSVLSQAYAVNENFGFQRETLASINRRITGAASQVPGLNSLMSRISAKKRRDGVILGSFIAFCFLMLFFFS